MRSLTALAVIVVGVVMSGCGDDGPSKEEIAKDRRQVAFVVDRSFTAKAPRNECATYTPQLALEVFGGSAACLNAARPSGLEPREVRFGGIVVDGDEARAYVELHGNGQGGVEGRMTLRRDGGWHIDGLGEDLLRTILVNGLTGPAYADEPVISSRSMRRCASTMLQGLPERRVRGIAYNWLRPVESSGRLFNDGVVRPCLTRFRGGREVLRREFEAGVAASGRDLGQDPGERRCVRQRLRRAITSRAIADEALRETDEYGEEISRAIDRATAKCT